MSPANNVRRTNLQIFKAPILLAVLSFAGLIAALVGDGPYDVVSWIALSVPCITISWFLWKARPQPT